MTAIQPDRSTESPNRLLTADELADRWQVPRSWVYAASRAGRIPTLRLGHYCRYRLDAIEEWEATHQTAGP